MGKLLSLVIKYLVAKITFVLFLFGGSLIFVRLERPQELINKKTQQFNMKLKDSILKKSNISSLELDDYVERKIAESQLQGGIEFFEGLELCFSIAFTTGWGYIVPTTHCSKIFFLFYSVFAICGAGVVFKIVSDILILLMYRLIRKVEKLSFGSPTNKHLSLKCACLMVLLLFTFMIVTASVRHHMGYNWLDAFYVTFQSYTTIGNGFICFNYYPTFIIVYLLSLIKFFFQFSSFSLCSRHFINHPTISNLSYMQIYHIQARVYLVS